MIDFLGLFRWITRPFVIWFGSARIPVPPTYPPGSVVTTPVPFFVHFFVGAFYLNLPAQTSALVITNKGNYKYFTDGGYHELQPGAYQIQFVNCQELHETLPPVAAKTRDRLNVTLKVMLSYRVNEPMYVVNTSDSLRTFFSACDGGLRRFINLHEHDELVSARGQKPTLRDADLLKDLIGQLSGNTIHRAFNLTSVSIIEVQGDFEIVQIDEKRLVQERNFNKEQESLKQQQELFRTQQALERSKVEQEGAMREMRTRVEANSKQIMATAIRLTNELDQMSKQPDRQQSQEMRNKDILEKALQSMVLRAQSTPNFPNTPEDTKLIENILKMIAKSPSSDPTAPVSEQTKKVDELSSSLRHLLLGE